MSKRRILEGHKQSGKRFIPPMKQLPGMQMTSYVNDMLPELIWIGLLNDRLDYVATARLVEKIVQVAAEAAPDAKGRNYALCSHLGALEDPQRAALLQTLDTEGLLTRLRLAIAPLVLLYEDFPMAFVGPPEDLISRETLLDRIYRAIDRHIDKYQTPGIILNGEMLLTRLVSGTIKFSADIKIPDFNAVLEAPESDEARHAAGFMRANALGEFGMLKVDNRWARAFWNTNYTLSACEFVHNSE